MFKTDKASIDKLSFYFGQEKITLLRNFLGFLEHEGLSSLPEDEAAKEIQRLREGLASIERLQLDGKVYGFYVEDTYASQQGGDAGEGLELYLRQGDKLQDFAIFPSRDGTLKVDEVLPVLYNRNINTIYTGPINEIFLGISAECDPEDPMYRSKLQDYQIS